MYKLEIISNDGKGKKETKVIDVEVNAKNYDGSTEININNGINPLLIFDSETCGNCNNYDNSYCRVWNYEVRWCGSCKYYRIKQ